MEKLPCITLIQPWASWIDWGWKTWETRTHNRFASLAGKECYIHAGAKWDHAAVDNPYLAASCILHTQSIGLLHKGPHLLTKVRFGPHRKMTVHDSMAALIDCGTTAPSRWGLQIIARETIVSDEAFMPGKQGIWYPFGKP